MSRPYEADIDAAIMAALAEFGADDPTYVVRNRLEWKFHIRLSAPQVLYRLKKLEKAGKVERVPSNYAVMICWRVKE